jgi:hypothetical protein
MNETTLILLSVVLSFETLSMLLFIVLFAKPKRRPSFDGVAVFSFLSHGFSLGLQSVVKRIGANVRQPEVSKMNEIQRVSTDLRMFLPIE